MSSATDTRDSATRGGAVSLHLADLAATGALGEQIGRALRAGDVVVLDGELGAGKTALTKAIAVGMGVPGTITSPTFVIARVHPGSGVPLVHVDAYRLEGAVELDDLDLATDLTRAAVVVEWGSGVAEHLADSPLTVRLTRHPDDSRTAVVEGAPGRWGALLAELGAATGDRPTAPPEPPVLPVLPPGIRPARPDDVPLVVALVRELAAYEREPEAATATEEHLHAALFGPDPVARCLIAEADGEGVGMALWFPTFSTWTGLPGIHLEDLFVRPSARGRGLGLALVTALAAIARHHGWPRVEWAVLDWNTPAVEFYRSLGAGPMTGWSTFRLTGDALDALARRAGG